MQLALIERSRAIGEALARSLLGEPIERVLQWVSIEDLLQHESSSAADLVAVAASAVRQIDQLLLLTARSPRLRVALIDDRHEAEQAGFCQVNGIQYVSQDCSVTELRAALLCESVNVGGSQNTLRQEEPSLERHAHRRDRPQSPLLAALTPRELQVLRLVAQGNSVRECAEQLNLSHSTVDNHKSRMMAKLRIHKSIELVYFAIRIGLVSIDDPLS